MTAIFNFQAGTVPLLVSMPHIGTQIPAHLLSHMTPAAAEKADTDWHLGLLYNMLPSLGASVLQANYSRYVIDLNRPEEDSNLYPGQDTTGLCPIDTFKKEALYHDGKAPTQAEIKARIKQYWRPYHLQLQDELQRLKKQFGCVVLWDAHSITSHVPRFFQGRLPDLNFGTVNQTSCALSLQQALESTMQTHLQTSPEESKLTHVWNGRFKGGYITRAYGQPSQGVHAVQLEMSQILYMDEAPPFAYRPDLAEQIQALIAQLLQTCITWAQDQVKAANDV